jgi:glycosyltransferase involved in cell wall biosynthesis
MRVLLAVPAYWPALSFGGPIWIARDLCEGLVARGHTVDVVTTSLEDLEHGLSVRTRTTETGGVRIHYLATPLRYRWMGVTPSLPLLLARLGRPDVGHVIGFRDPVGTTVAAWCRLRRIPYVLEPQGMFQPRLRKVRLKRALDPLLRPLARGAALLVATSELERRDLLAGGLAGERIAIRPNPFPPVRPGRTGLLRRRLGLADDEALVLYVGRLGAGKGLELLIDAVGALPDVQLALVGPADDPDVVRRVRAAGERVHVLPPWTEERPLELYGDADVFVLASDSERENFGVAAAEAAAAGVPLVVTDRTGIAELARDRAALVVPPEAGTIRAAVAQVLEDGELRKRLAAGALALAKELSAEAIVEQQEGLYRSIVSA